ncbi:FAD binding domain-containing protein [Streptomyces fagopyri]|uniref:FAD binding domain-containing protein n=1 Tax=Streptomyces fagopyri TaxID=2662397 RepID=UPI0033EEEBB6
MRTFDYVRAVDTREAVRLLADDPGASCLAGGTTQLDLMKDGVLEPPTLIDITRLPLHGIEPRGESLHVGALVTMEELAADPVVAERLPMVREALLLGASVQLRNMATIGGNLLQRTRCRYFRDPAVPECNKRVPGSGCSAVKGVARMHAVLGASERCIALHASDLAVALVSLDAVVHVQGVSERRTVPLTEFYLTADESPERENVLEHAELITEVEIPLPPATARSGYLKVRDRASYEFALASAAVLLVVQGGVIQQARVGLGGVGTKPWRAYEAEHVLTGAPATTAVFTDASEATMRDAFTVPGTAFKVPLARRTLVRELQTVSGVKA